MGAPSFVIFSSVSSHCVFVRRAATMRSGGWHFEQTAWNSCAPASSDGSCAAADGARTESASTITALAAIHRPTRDLTCDSSRAIRSGPIQKVYYSSPTAMSWNDLGCVILVALLWPSSAAAQLQVSALNGVVVDAQQQVVVGAAIVLQDSTGTTVAARTTAADGTFQIADIAPGSYILRVELRSAALLSRRIVIRGSLPVELVLDVGPSLQEDVVVRGDAGGLSAEEPASIAGDTVRRTEERLPQHRIQSAVVRLP